jgi:hypothetical protein
MGLQYLGGLAQSMELRDQMSYYVSHMTPMKRARIHKGDCVHCRDGQGQENQEKNNSGATGWSQRFETLAEAEAYMDREFPRFTDKGKCNYCNPGAD